MNIAMDYPALLGEPVTQAHSDYCAEHGHGTHTIYVDGLRTASPWCPRCGASTTPAEEPAAAPEVKTWRHARKGLITGTLVDTSTDGEWLHIRLATDHQLRYASISNRGRVDEEGEILTARKSLLTEVEVKA